MLIYPQLFRGSEGTDVKLGDFFADLLMAPLDVRAKALEKHREMNGFMSFFGGSVAVQVPRRLKWPIRAMIA